MKKLLQVTLLSLLFSCSADKNKSGNPTTSPAKAEKIEKLYQVVSSISTKNEGIKRQFTLEILDVSGLLITNQFEYELNNNFDHSNQTYKITAKNEFQLVIDCIDKECMNFNFLILRLKEPFKNQSLNGSHRIYKDVKVHLDKVGAHQNITPTVITVEKFHGLYSHTHTADLSLIRLENSGYIFNLNIDYDLSTIDNIDDDFEFITNFKTRIFNHSFLTSIGKYSVKKEYGNSRRGNTEVLYTKDFIKSNNTITTFLITESEQGSMDKLHLTIDL